MTRTGRPRKVERWTVEDRGHDSPCWVWQGAKRTGGYGCVFWDGRTQNAHRAIYEMRVGPVPAHADLDHLCRVRACVNPSHMQPVTPAENSRRGANAKLTYDDVAEIRTLLAAGARVVTIAERFGCSTSNIKAIRAGRLWSAPGGVVV